jgi:hypothetical protein
VLGTEGSGNSGVPECCKCIQRVDQVPRDRRWMRKECHPASRERAAQFGFVEQSINSKLHIFPECFL